MGVVLELTERQAENLKDIVDIWLEGHEPATEDVIDDPSFDTVEEMLDAVDGMHAQFRDAVDIRQQLWMAIRVAT